MLRASGQLRETNSATGDVVSKKYLVYNKNIGFHIP